MADLVERLRRWASIDSGERAVVLTDAADALARVTRERDELRSALRDAMQWISGLTPLDDAGLQNADAAGPLWARFHALTRPDTRS